MRYKKLYLESLSAFWDFSRNERDGYLKERLLPTHIDSPHFPRAMKRSSGSRGPTFSFYSLYSKFSSGAAFIYPSLRLPLFSPQFCFPHCILTPHFSSAPSRIWVHLHSLLFALVISRSQTFCLCITWRPWLCLAACPPAGSRAPSRTLWYGSVWTPGLMDPRYCPFSVPALSSSAQKDWG